MEQIKIAEGKEEYTEKKKRYECDMCNYSTDIRSHFFSHLNTRKHNRMVQAGGKKVFRCDLCEYSTSQSCNYKRHLLSAKHVRKLHIETEMMQDKLEDLSSMVSGEVPKLIEDKEEIASEVLVLNEKNEYMCEDCGYRTIKLHNFRRHLNSKRHKGNSYEKRGPKFKNSVTVYEGDKSVSNDIVKDIKELIPSDKEAIATLMQQNKMLSELMSNQLKVMSEMIPKIGNVTNNTINNITLVAHFNETRKDALTMTQFNAMLKPLSSVELFKFNEMSYSQSMAEIFESRLKALPDDKLPMICYDPKSIGFLVNVDGHGWKVDKDNIEILNSVGSASKAAYECILSFLEDDVFMSKHGNEIMEVLSKISSPRAAFTKTTVEAIANIDKTQNVVNSKILEGLEN